MELRKGLDALAKKTVKDRRRRRAIEAAVMKAKTNFDWLGHCARTLPFNLDRDTNWKALKDGWGRRECQDEMTGWQPAAYQAVN
jgi:hypothetical protein